MPCGWKVASHTNYMETALLRQTLFFFISQVPGECSSVDWEILCQPNVKVIWKDGATYRSVNQRYSVVYTVPENPYISRVPCQEVCIKLSYYNQLQIRLSYNGGGGVILSKMWREWGVGENCSRLLICHYY